MYIHEFVTQIMEALLLKSNLLEFSINSIFFSDTSLINFPGDFYKEICG